MTLPKHGADWRERLLPLTYTSPSGQEISAHYYSTRRKREVVGTEWRFPDVSGGYVQRTALGGRAFPLTFVFEGPYCDQQASLFEQALFEPGVATLQTPLYGRVQVEPLGEIERTDDLAERANIATVRVDLIETLETLYPSETIDAPASVEAAAEAFSEASTAALDRQLDVSTEQRKLRAEDTTRNSLQAARQGLSGLTRRSASIRSQVEGKISQMEAAVGDLVASPQTLVSDLASVFNLAEDAAVRVGERLEGIGSVLSALFDQSSVTGQSTLPQEDENSFAIVSTVAGAAAVGGMRASAREDFDSRPQALSTAVTIVELSERNRDWREGRADTIGVIDDADVHLALHNAASASLQLLIESSRSLPPERVITLKRDRGLLELASELLGSVDDEALNKLIVGNDLTGKEIVILPRGRKVRYNA